MKSKKKIEKKQSTARLSADPTKTVRLFLYEDLERFLAADGVKENKSRNLMINEILDTHYYGAPRSKLYDKTLKRIK